MNLRNVNNPDLSNSNCCQNSAESTIQKVLTNYKNARMHINININMYEIDL